MSYKCRGWLYIQYWVLEKSQIQIASESNVLTNTIYRNMKKMKIPARTLTKIQENKHKHKKYRDKNWLQKQYIELKKSIRDIAKICNCHHETIREWLIFFDIKRRINFEIIASLTDEQCWNWKGDNASSKSFHSYILKRKEKFFICEECNEKKTTELSFNHFLENYTRNINDYKWLCRKCHIRRDYEEFGFRKRNFEGGINK